MSHPYHDLESLPMWKVLSEGLNELHRNRDLAMTTDSSYIVGYLLRKITGDNQDDSVSLRLSAQRALWGHVPAYLRSASIEKNGDTIRWQCVFDIEATDDDLELVQMAGAQIIADFSAPTVIEDHIVISQFPDKADHLKYLVFLRHEHNYYKDQPEQVAGCAGEKPHG